METFFAVCSFSGSNSKEGIPSRDLSTDIGGQHLWQWRHISKVGGREAFVVGSFRCDDIWVSRKAVVSGETRRWQSPQKWSSVMHY